MRTQCIGTGLIYWLLVVVVLFGVYFAVHHLPGSMRWFAWLLLFLLIYAACMCLLMTVIEGAAELKNSREMAEFKPEEAKENLFSLVMFLLFMQIPLSFLLLFFSGIFMFPLQVYWQASQTRFQILTQNGTRCTRCRRQEMVKKETRAEYRDGPNTILYRCKHCQTRYYRKGRLNWTVASAGEYDPEFNDPKGWT